MGRHRTNRLSAVAINAKKTPGYYADGNCLYLQVSTTGSKSWVLWYTLNKQRREMGLGSVADRTLSEARELAHRYRLLLHEGIDPLEHREAERQKNRWQERKNVRLSSVHATTMICTQVLGKTQSIPGSGLQP
jgi:hypothetical protein